MNVNVVCSYSNNFRRNFFLKVLNKLYFNKKNDFFLLKKIFVKVCGRIIRKRIIGSICFMYIKDFSSGMQICLQKDFLLNIKYNTFISYEIGDIVGVTGFLFKTKTDELSIKVKNIILLSKFFKTFPSKWHGLNNLEIRYRKRYLDLIINERSSNIFKIRSKIIQIIRNFLLKREYLEVETPMMQTIPGGAVAKPFITYHNSLNMKLFMRISPELYLKRLVVGGFERVFEIGKNFRNEGLSTRHNPEFTMIEFYQAYSDYNDMMNLTEKLFKVMAKNIFGKFIVKHGSYNIDFSMKFLKMTVEESLIIFNFDVCLFDLRNINIFKKKFSKYFNILGCDIYKLYMKLFEITVESELINPIFITQHPSSCSPLSRKNDKNRDFADRFELYICGKEIANGFSELNNPEEQLINFKNQTLNFKENKDDFISKYDVDYIESLKYGLPPTAGEGIGIDRLVMIFTNTFSIKDVILFPLMKFVNI